MRIVHDQARCASLGMCEAVAPDLFQVGSDGVLVVLDPTPPEALRALALQAAEVCPTGALSIEE